MDCKPEAVWHWAENNAGFVGVVSDVIAVIALIVAIFSIFYQVYSAKKETERRKKALIASVIRILRQLKLKGNRLILIERYSVAEKKGIAFDEFERANERTAKAIGPLRFQELGDIELSGLLSETYDLLATNMQSSIKDETKEHIMTERLDSLEEIINYFPYQNEMV